MQVSDLQCSSSDEFLLPQACGLEQTHQGRECFWVLEDWVESQCIVSRSLPDTGFLFFVFVFPSVMALSFVIAAVSNVY